VLKRGDGKRSDSGRAVPVKARSSVAPGAADGYVMGTGWHRAAGRVECIPLEEMLAAPLAGLPHGSWSAVVRDARIRFGAP
jgi:hypothetical protein